MRIAVVAAGVGNVRSVVRALEHARGDRGEVVATADPEVVRRADALVVPGQGSFGAFAAALDGGLREALVERIAAGAPYLGICLGLQILFEASDEAEGARGLGVLPGRVRRLAPGDDAAGRRLPLPHVGWGRADAGDLASPVTSDHYYFAHSYAAPAEAGGAVATTRYGAASFASAVAEGPLLAVQFHPEKSQRAGLALIARFFSRAGGAR